MMTTNQQKIETKMDAIQEKKDANLREILVDRTRGQQAKSHGGQSREDGAKSRRRGGRNRAAGEEVAFHSLRACQNERTGCQEVTEANPEKMDPVDHAIAILEKMEATDLKANPEEMKSESEHGRYLRKVP
jgi:hypothetical protein